MKATWLVGFAPAYRPYRWWEWLLRRGYAHAWAARAIDTDLWLWVEWLPNRVLYGLANSDTVMRSAAAATEVLGIDLDIYGEERRLVLPRLCAWHCATLVAHTLGIRTPPFLTPWRLRCALSRRGALPIVRPEPSAVEAAP